MDAKQKLEVEAILKEHLEPIMKQQAEDKEQHAEGRKQQGESNKLVAHHSKLLADHRLKLTFQSL